MNSDRNRILNELVAALHLNQQQSNIFGLYFVNEDKSTTDHLSVVILLRNVNKFFKFMKINHCENGRVFVRIDGELKEVIDLKESNLSLMFLKNDTRCMSKLFTFDNARNWNLPTSWNLLEKVIKEKPDEVKSIIITKKRIFVTFATDLGQTELLRALLLNFGTDFNTKELSHKLVFVRKNSNTQRNGLFNYENFNIVVNF